MTEQCFSCSWTVLAQPQGLPCSSLCPLGGVGRRGEGPARTAASQWPKRFSMLLDIMLSIKLGVVVCQNKPLLRGCLTIGCWWEVVSDALASVVWFLFFSFTNSPYLSTWVFFLHFPLWFSPPPCWGGSYLPAGIHPSSHSSSTSGKQ